MLLLTFYSSLAQNNSIAKDKYAIDSNSDVRLCVSLQVYDHQYKAVLDGVETDSMMEIDPGQRIEIFRMGNGSEEVLEVHDFKNVSKRLKQGRVSYPSFAENSML